jgi:hypothetical protein
MHRARHAPTDDATGEHIDDKRDVDKPAPRRDIREVGHPELIGPARQELPIDPVEGSFGVLLRDRRPALAAAHNAVETGVTHQPLDRTAGDDESLAAKLPPDLARAVDLEVLLIHAANLLCQDSVAPQPWR